MKNIIVLSFGILLSGSLTSCSKIASNSSACNSAGYYGDQSECQNSISSGSCTSTTVTASDKSLVCWTASSTSSQTGNTGTTTSTGCSGASPPWTTGAWTPAACSPSVTQRTRTVTCNYSCACSATVPSTTESCEPDLFNNQHYESQCTALGGTAIWIEGNRVCQFSGNSCKSGWQPLYYNGSAYTITVPASATNRVNCFGKTSTVTTGSHSTFTPFRTVETAQYCSSRNCFGCKTYSTVSASVTSVACY